MNEPFILPLTYQNKELEFEAGFQRYGYTHRIGVVIGDVTVLFEPDEEGSYRALVSAEQIDKSDKLSIGLLQAMAQKLQQLSK